MPNIWEKLISVISLIHWISLESNLISLCLSVWISDGDFFVCYVVLSQALYTFSRRSHLRKQPFICKAYLALFSCHGFGYFHHKRVQWWKLSRCPVMIRLFCDLRQNLLLLNYHIPETSPWANYYLWLVIIRFLVSRCTSWKEVIHYQKTLALQPHPKGLLLLRPSKKKLCFLIIVK